MLCSRRRAALLAFALAMARAGYAAAQDPAPSRPYGVWEDLAWDQTADVDGLIDRMAAAGVQNVRMAFRWYMIEPTNDQWVFTYHDPIVAKLRAKGIEILGLLQHTPAWAVGGNPAGTSPPVNDADWQDFVSRVVTHYRGQVAAWEVWNEENLVAFFTPQPDPVRYVQMLKVATTAIRSADPSALVVLGGLAGNGQDFLPPIYANGGKDYFDVVAIHPYKHPVTEGLDTLRWAVGITHDLMAANGDATKPLWFTEIGWTVGPDSSPPITEADQANWVTTVYNARSSLGADRIYWYELHELYTPPYDEGWGLIRHDLSLRPSYYAYQALTSRPPATLLHTLTPCRLVDTRGTDAPALVGGGSRIFVLTGKCGLPATAKAVSINVTVTGATAPGDLRLLPAGATLPLVSAINYSPGQTRANSALVALGAGGGLAVQCDQAAGSSTHVILDVNGYFE
jgi:hypothetical protein